MRPVQGLHHPQRTVVAKASPRVLHSYHLSLFANNATLALSGENEEVQLESVGDFIKRSGIQTTFVSYEKQATAGKDVTTEDGRLRFEGHGLFAFCQLASVDLGTTYGLVVTSESVTCIVLLIRQRAPRRIIIQFWIFIR
jgi:hypothetical protein